MTKENNKVIQLVAFSCLEYLIVSFKQYYWKIVYLLVLQIQSHLPIVFLAVQGHRKSWSNTVCSRNLRWIRDRVISLCSQRSEHSYIWVWTIPPSEYKCIQRLGAWMSEKSSYLPQNSNTDPVQWSTIRFPKWNEEGFVIFYGRKHVSYWKSSL